MKTVKKSSEDLKNNEITLQLSESELATLKYCSKHTGMSDTDTIIDSIKRLYNEITTKIDKSEKKDSNEKRFYEIYGKRGILINRFEDFMYTKVGEAVIIPEPIMVPTPLDLSPRLLYRDSQAITKADDSTRKSVKKEWLGLNVYSDITKDIMFGRIVSLLSDKKISTFPLFGPGMDIKHATVT